MCLATMALVKEEETQLIEVFGKPYLDYKNRVGRIISFPKK
jgi:protein-S-isoprenylcysteine O-methyltransferase Ste14